MTSLLSQTLYWFPQTKFAAPALDSKVVERSQLLARLEQDIKTHRLTLLSAPAGSGKTTVLASLCQSCPLRFAWLALDEEDNDPIYFMAALIKSLRNLDAVFGEMSLAILDSQTSASFDGKKLISSLINDVLRSFAEPFVIVLDDLHAVTNAVIYNMLDYLLERLPAQMHLVIASRYDPPLTLPRLRARNQLAEFRLPQLRFSQEEVGTFLNTNFGFNLSPSATQQVQERTEGWAAGLRLLANSLTSLGSTQSRTAFIDSLGQNNQFLFDYLAEEVLGHQSWEVQTFLLETSILEELTPEICESVTGRADAREILRDLYRHNLFIVAIDESRSIYRYHELFARFLQTQLTKEMPEMVPLLHKWAAHAQTRPAATIHHYVAAEMWDDAANAIEEVGQQFLQSGLINTLLDWISVLPEAVVARYGWLNFYIGYYAYVRGDPAKAIVYLGRAKAKFEEVHNELGVERAIVLLASNLAGIYDFEGCAKLVTAGLAHATLFTSQVVLLNLKVWLSMLSQKWDEARVDFEEAITIALQSDEPLTLAAMGQFNRAHVTLLPGGLELLEGYCETVLAKSGDHLLTAGIHSILACIDLWRGRCDLAIKALEKARTFSQQRGGLAAIDIEIDGLHAMYYSSKGDYAALDKYLNARLPELARITAIGHWIPMLMFLQGRSAWLQGNLDETRRIVSRLVAREQLFELPGTPTLRLMLEAMLLLSEHRYTEAAQLLLPTLPVEAHTRFTTLFGSVQLLLAEIYLQAGQTDQALTHLTPLLAKHKQQNTPGLLLKEGPSLIPLLRLALKQAVYPDFVAFLLDKLGLADELPEPVDNATAIEKSDVPTLTSYEIPGTGERLSSREIEVIWLLAQRASNREIAKQLIISEPTVKSHVSNILRKLDLTSRNEVAARARQLHLL